MSKGGAGLWEPTRGVRPSEQLPPPGLKGQGEGVAWHEPSMAVGGEIPPATMAKVRGSPAKVHPGGEGMEEGWRKQTQSLFPQPPPPISCSAPYGPNAWDVKGQGSLCGTICRGQPQYAEQRRVEN